MTAANDLVIPLGVLLVSVMIVSYLRRHIKKNLSIGKIASAKVMSIYLIFCILAALSTGYVFSWIIHQKIGGNIPPLLTLPIDVTITILLLIGTYWFLFLPEYHTWKERLQDWVGNNPEEEIKELEKKINHLNMEIRGQKKEEATLSSVAMKVDVMYYKQRLDSLERSRRVTRFMNVFVAVFPVISLILEVVIFK